MLADEPGELRAALRQLFPLQTGNTASFTILPEGVGEWRLTYTVHGRQTLTVPAGRFETWVIDYEQQLMLAGNFLGRERLFLADNGMIIRREPTVVRGYVPPGSPFAKLPSQAVSIRMP